MERSMPDARMIAEWQEELSAQGRTLELLKADLMHTGGKSLKSDDDSSRAIEHAKGRIAQLEAWIAGRPE